MYDLVARENPLEASVELPTETIPVVDEFRDIFLDDLPDEFPSMRDIQHTKMWDTVLPIAEF
ncbi:hypothetical protein PJP07_30920, partial [Mycobacterium kansasii]